MKTLFNENHRMQMLCPGQSVDGILGYEYLRQVKMTIDFKRNTITFHENNQSFMNELATKL